MLAINPAIPIYIHAEPIDMRKNFDGLFGIVKADLQRDVRNGGLAKQKDKIDTLHTSLQVALAEIRFLRSGRKREKFINANQLLLEFPEDKELQASLEAARKEAEEEVERITYTRKKQAKPKITKRDSFPDHLPREEIEVVIPGEFQLSAAPFRIVMVMLSLGFRIYGHLQKLPNEYSPLETKQSQRQKLHLKSAVMAYRLDFMPSLQLSASVQRFVASVLI